MQKLFPAPGETTPALRFPGFRDAPPWQVKRLGEVVEFAKGKGIAKADVTENGKTPCIRYGELYTEYGEYIDQIVSRTNTPLKGAVLSKRNDVLMPTSDVTPTGLATASALDIEGVIIGGDTLIIRSKELLNLYLAYFVTANKPQIMRLVTGVAVFHIYARDLASLQVCIPSLPEQREITDCLQTWDEALEKLKALREALKLQKRGLMQKLFPRDTEKCHDPLPLQPGAFPNPDIPETTP